MLVHRALLGLLAAGPTHGYRLKQRWDAHLGATWPLSLARVYEQLGVLRADGLIAAVAAGDRPAPRRRQAVQLTARGAEALGAWLGTSTYCPRLVRDDVLLRLAVMLEMGATDVSPVLLREAATATYRRRRLERQLDGATPPLSRLGIEAEILQTEGYLSWLARCEAVFAALERPPTHA